VRTVDSTAARNLCRTVVFVQKISTRLFEATLEVGEATVLIVYVHCSSVIRNVVRASHVFPPLQTAFFAFRT